MVWFWLQVHKACWKKLGYQPKIKIFKKLQSETASSKVHWVFSVKRFWNVWKLSFGTIITINLSFWSTFYLSLSKLAIKTPYCIAKPYKYLGKAIFLFIYPPSLLRRGRFSWSPCTAIINILWSRPWKKYLGLTTIFCLVSNHWSIKLGHWFRPAE